MPTESSKRTRAVLLVAAVRPLVDALFEAGHTVEVYDGSGLNATLRGADALVVAPTSGTDGERRRVVFRTAVPVAATGERARLSTSRRAGAYPVTARNGNAAAVGDIDAFGPADTYTADNEVFLSNLAAFLVSGEKAPGAPEESESESDRSSRG